MLGKRLSADEREQPRLGRLMASLWQGAIIWWGFSRSGTVETHVANQLEAFLAASDLLDR